MFDTPILYLFFNRPEFTEITFTRICEIKPKILFIAADGPRFNISQDYINCKNARELVLSKITWDCDLHILFREENLGCGKAVSSAITWFFDHVDEGIILEDDCLPNISFFRFCSELLAFYRFDHDVMAISGSNLLGDKYNFLRDSYLWGFGGIWGWATWKRAWSKYDYEMSKLYNLNTANEFEKYFKNRDWYIFYNKLFESVKSKEIDTWDAQWLYTIAISGGLCINASVNLVENIGFGNHATHTTDSDSFMNGLKAFHVNFPLSHPLEKKVDEKYLKLLYNRLTTPKGYSFRSILKKLKYYFTQC